MSAWPNRVTVGEFVADRDEPGDFRLVTKMTGWQDGAPSRVALEDRAQQDGGWDAAGNLGQRTVGIEGMVERSTAADADAVAAELTALHPRLAHRLVVDSESVGSREALVRVTGAAVLDWIDDSSFTYALQVTAPDPLRYGPEVFGQTGLSGVSGTGRVWPRVWPTDWGVPAGVTAGLVPVGNAGTATYWPRLRIVGPATNPVVTFAETGDWIRYEGTVAAGQHLDIDCGNRRVTLGDSAVSMRHKVTFSGSWLAVPVGGGSITWSGDTADPAATLSVWSREGAWS